MDNAAQGTSTAPSKAAHAPPTPKKLKPKAIDSVFTEYNGLLSDACRKLMNYIKYWRNVLATSGNIPEGIVGDISSAIGKGKLLLDSKLPQFTQLLFSYLCKETHPVVLEGDLQGWWAVAEIQIVQVYEEYDRLKVIQERNWVQDQDAVAGNSTSLMTPPLKKTKVKTLSRSHSLKATPSRELKNFLSTRRSSDGTSDASV